MTSFVPTVSSTSKANNQPGTSKIPWKVPVFLTPLIGREQDVADICALLQRSEVRLLNLLGPGGIGKTRLSCQIAAELRGFFADGIYFVALAPLLEPDRVVPTIAHELDILEKDISPFEQLQEFLGEKRMLLILDNFEQVVRAAPSLEKLLETCPHVKILVTSRVALRLNSEQRVPVTPLVLPDLKQHFDKVVIAGYAAIALFVQRAQAHVPTFAVTTNNAAVLAEICVQLDGLPLAIELAAARIKLLPPHALLPRLANRLQVLTRGVPTLPARQQTLRSTIQWSYDLLEPEEQRLFRLLSIFVGGCTIEAAEALFSTLNDDGGKESESILDEVESLVEKSLLRPLTLEEREEEPRIHMLATIREYGRECLIASGEMETTQRAHAEYYLQLVEEVETKLAGPEQAKWLHRIEHEHDNLRVALQWSLERGEAQHTMEMALRFGGALRRFWLVHGHLHEGRTFLERMLAGSEGARTSVRGKALNAAANIALNQGDVNRAEVLAEESRILYRLLGETHGIAFSLHQLERVARARGDLRVARQLSEEALTLFKETDDKERVAWSFFRLARLHKEQGEYDKACTLAEESLKLHREIGNQEGIASALFQVAQTLFVAQGDQSVVSSRLTEAFSIYEELGDKEDIADCLSLSSQIAFSHGDTSTARSLAEESVNFSREIGDQEGLAESLPILAKVLTAQGNFTATETLYEECLTIAGKTGNKLHIAICLEGLADVIVAQATKDISSTGMQAGKLLVSRAVQLWGAAERLRQAIGAPIAPVDRASYEHAITSVRMQLGEQDFAEAWTEGQLLSLEGISVARIKVMDIQHIVPTSSREIVTVQGIPMPTQQATPARKVVSYPDDLTAREVDVLRLLAQGCSDTQIAESLIISPRTVNSHVTSIYRKIQVTSRSAATRYAIEHQLN